MGEYRHGLFGCFDNCGLCIITYFCPCYTFGKTAEAVGDSCCLCAVALLCTGCIAGGIMRGKVREKNNIDGSVLTDFCLAWLCPICAIIQDNQEVVGSGIGNSIARV